MTDLTGNYSADDGLYQWPGPRAVEGLIQFWELAGLIQEEAGRVILNERQGEIVTAVLESFGHAVERAAQKDLPDAVE